MVLPLYHYGSFSRKIISWNISSRPNADLVIQTFQKAYHTRNCPAGLMFHSDRGSQYITFAFRKLLDELNVVQSFSKKAYPFDNACCESFFKYLKKEETNRRNFRTYRDLYHSVFQYIKDFSQTTWFFRLSDTRRNGNNILGTTRNLGIPRKYI